jgi:hypothetical protein
MQTHVNQPGIVKSRLLVLMLAALLAFAALAVTVPGAGATTMAIAEPEAEAHPMEDSLDALLSSVDGSLTTANIVFFEQNVVLPTTDVGTGIGEETLPESADQSSSDESSLPYPWSDDPSADY